jgi:hypothetical protein
LPFANKTIFWDNCKKYNQKKTPIYHAQHLSSIMSIVPCSTTLFLNHVQCTSLNTACFSNSSNVPTFGSEDLSS